MAERIGNDKIAIANFETKTLKELRDELKALKKELEGLVIESDEYKSKLEEVNTYQKALSQATKSSVADMEGSYNALNKELNELRKAWKATNDEAERDALGSQMAEINAQLKDLDASVGNFQRNVGNYTSALDGLDDKLKETGFSFDDAINRSNNWVEKGEHIEKTSIAMVASFAMINQTLSLMGDESEEARAVLEKLQIVMAMTAGFKQIAEGARGFLQLTKSINLSKVALTGFKTALIGTGIGALVVAVGALIANWDKLTSLWNDTSAAEKSLQALNQLNGKMSEINFQTEKAIAIAKAKGATDIEVLEMQLAASIKAEQEASKAHRDAVKQKEAEDKGWFRSASEETKQLVEESEKLWKERSKETQKIRDQLEIRKAVLPIEQENTRNAQQQQAYQESITNQLKEQERLRNAKLDAQREYSELLKSDMSQEQLVELNYKEKITQFQSFLEQGLLTQAEYDKAAEILAVQRANAIADIYEGMLEKGEEKVEEKKEETKQDDTEEELKNYEKVVELGNILVQTADEVGSAWGEVFESITNGIQNIGDTLESGEKGWTKYGKIASVGIGVASDMLGSLADMQDTQTEEGFEKNKKLQIASATMAMLGGIINVWQSAMSKENAWMTIWGQAAAGTTLSAMMLATGLAQINQIKSTTFEGGGGAGNAIAPSMTALQAIQNPVDNVNVVQGASTESEIQSQRIYVLESDIADTTKKVNVAQSEAIF